MKFADFQVEFMHYCRLSRMLAALDIADVPAFDTRRLEVIDDLEVLAMHTEWSNLRMRALSRINSSVSNRAAVR